MNKKILGFLFALLVLNPTLVLAQTNNTGGLPQYNRGVDTSIRDYLCTPSEPADGHDLERCVNRLYKFGVAVGALALVFFVVLAGYTYITGGETAKTKAKGMIYNSMIGMGLLLGSYLLLYFINPSLVSVRIIQPPIFTAQLPDCGDVGLGEGCLLSSEDASVVTSTKGNYADCPNGIIAFEKSAVPVNQGSDTDQVCKALMEKLKAIHAQQKITVTSTIGSQHESRCHKPGFSVSGVCADVVPQNGNFESLCQVVSAAGLALLNESGKSSSACGTYVKTTYATGAHLHIWLKK